MQYMILPLRIINANTLKVKNLYTNKEETFTIAGTQISHSKYVNNAAIKYIDINFLHNGYMGAISYGHDKWGRVVGDIKHLDRIQRLSYLLIVQGYVYWYPPFNPLDSCASACAQWAKQKHIGVWK